MKKNVLANPTEKIKYIKEKEREKIRSDKMGNDFLYISIYLNSIVLY
jgi:hypothetical protein